MECEFISRCTAYKTPRCTTGWSECEVLKVHKQYQSREADVCLNNLLSALSVITKGLKRIDSPRKTTYHTKHYQYVVGIGNDHVATLTIDEDALKALNDMGI